MPNLFELLRTALGRHFEPVADAFSATLAIFLILMITLVAVQVFLRLFLNDERYLIAREVIQDSLLFIAIGVFFSIVFQTISLFYPSQWLRSVAEYVHEGTIAIVLIMIFFSVLAKACERFQVCRLVVERIHQRIRSLL